MRLALDDVLSPDVDDLDAAALGRADGQILILGHVEAARLGWRDTVDGALIDCARRRLVEQPAQQHAVGDGREEAICRRNRQEVGQALVVGEPCVDEVRKRLALLLGVGMDRPIQTREKASLPRHGAAALLLGMDRPRVCAAVALHLLGECHYLGSPLRGFCKLLKGDFVVSVGVAVLNDVVCRRGVGAHLGQGGAHLARGDGARAVGIERGEELAKL